VSDAKVRSYLLSSEHPTGRAKAAFFVRLGFRAEAADELRDALLELAREGGVTSSLETPFGSKHVVDGYVTGPTGRSASVRTVWITEAGSSRPRLVTAYPLAKER